MTVGNDVALATDVAMGADIIVDDAGI